MELTTTPEIHAGDAVRAHNRIMAIMAHTSRYAFSGQAKLARDVGVSRSTINRLLSGRTQPSFSLVEKVRHALERELKRPLDPRELLSPDGSYPTASACTLCGCKGCLPTEAYDAEGNVRPHYRHIRPGQWSLSPPPGE